MTNKLIGIGDAAKLCQVSIDTIRLWDKKGLLKSSGRTLGNQRRFLEHEVLEVAKQMQKPSIIIENITEEDAKHITTSGKKVIVIDGKAEVKVIPGQMELPFDLDDFIAKGGSCS